MSDPTLERGGQTHKTASHSFTRHPPVPVDDKTKEPGDTVRLHSGQFSSPKGASWHFGETVRRFSSHAGAALLQKHEEYGEDEAEEGGDVVPVERLALEEEGDDDRKHDQGHNFLNDF